VTESNNNIPPVDDFLQADHGVYNQGVDPYQDLSVLPSNSSIGVSTKYDIFEAMKMSAEKAFTTSRTDNGIDGIRAARIIYIEELTIDSLRDPIVELYKEQIAGNFMGQEPIRVIYAAPAGGSCAMLTAPSTSEALNGPPTNPDFTRIQRFPRFYQFPWSQSIISDPIIGQICKVSFIDKHNLAFGEYHGMVNETQNLLALNNASAAVIPRPAGASQAFSGKNSSGLISGQRGRVNRTGSKGIAGLAYNGKEIPNSSFDTGLNGFYSRFNFKKNPTLLIIHESGMDHLAGLEFTLLSKRGGVHYAVSGGKAIQYSTLDRRLVHCRGKNNIALGIEFNHAYSSKKKEQITPARWFVRNRYAIPSLAQCEALYGLCAHICQKTGIPFKFNMLVGQNQFRMDKNVCESDTTGISSHRSVKDHTDGNFPSLYMCLRQLNHSPESAFQLTINLLRNPDDKGKARGVKPNSVIVLPYGSESAEPTPTPITPKEVMSKEKFFEMDRRTRNNIARRKNRKKF
jgi:hypothetical protein